ncbi:hypothetical protein BIV57_15040 [Mangrovactinospora gilvigrisea]|uniref:PPM-type phosphatase domain-containing protein n=1 Tax=Mangrovactinospora gilvigrisea TaxID=1428644 RepID=A0A1J7C548_9ACTN|nr:hypothetical protein BIV57_15040 [Mangrovactinospora gilvigrisea]
MIEDAEIVEDADEAALDPGLDTGLDLDFPDPGRDPGESPAYAFLVGSKRVRVPAQAAAAPAAQAEAAPPPPPSGRGGAFAPEVIGAVPPPGPAEPGPLPRYSDALPHLAVPDAELDGAEHDGLLVRAVSLRGDAARAAARPRKDAVRLARIGDGEDALLVMAVADGLGTAGYSHVGAHYACSTVVEAVAGFHEELLALLRAVSADGAEGGNGGGGAVAPGELPDDVRRLVNYAQEICRRTDVLLAKLAQQAELPVEECATALRCVVAPVDREAEARLLFTVGGGAFVRLRDGEWLPIELGDSAGGSVALPGAWDQARVRVEPSRSGDVLIACTDGVAELLPVPGVAERLATQWARVPGLAEFLHQVQVRVRGYDDDRSVIALWER